MTSWCKHRRSAAIMVDNTSVLTGLLNFFADIWETIFCARLTAANLDYLLKERELIEALIEERRKKVLIRHVDTHDTESSPPHHVPDLGDNLVSIRQPRIQLQTTKADKTHYIFSVELRSSFTTSFSSSAEITFSRRRF